MDLRQLRYFVAVAEELHFGRAAVRAGIAQPPLTQQIQKLEADLGCQLLVRGRKTVLTPAGEILLEQARRILAQSEGAVEATRRAARGETGQLTVGVPPSVMLSPLPAAIRKYRRLYPGVQFGLRELSTSAIERAVRAGEIDLGFLREALPASPLESEVVFQEGVVVALPSAHRLAKAKDLRIESLRGEPLVFFPRRLGPAFYDRMISFCTDAGFTPEVVQEATQWHSVICLVEAGMGISLAPACVQRFKWSGVVYRPLRGLRTRVSAAWNGNGSATVAAFLRIVRAGMR
jgi:LysR family transcriptional regulator, benzoate and cis,cis-muconate-responsive activator of ben and cat genes